MSDQPKENRRSLASMALAAIVLLVLYVLSIGPVQLICNRSGAKMSDPVVKFIIVFYAPLRWLGENVEPFGEFFTRYIIWWTSH
jgi:hypothetical protein